MLIMLKHDDHDTEPVSITSSSLKMPDGVTKDTDL